MTVKSDARVNISIDAPLVPFGQLQVRIREAVHQTDSKDDTAPRSREVAPYSFPSSTGDGHKLVFRQGASAW